MTRPTTVPTAGWIRKAVPFIIVAIFALALWVVHRELAHVNLKAVSAALHRLSPGRIAMALVFTAGSYAVLTLYDVLALRYVGRPLGYPRTALASFIGYVFNMNLGLSVLGSTAVRYRLYSAWGFSAVEIGKIVAFCATTTGLGLLAMTGTVLAAGQTPQAMESWIPAVALRPFGVVLIVAATSYIVACRRFRQPVRLASWEIQLPSGRVALAQLALACLDFLIAGSVLYALHPAGDVSFPVFLGVFLVAIVAGLISHVPGGLGVFETVFLLALPTAAPQAEVLATLLAFRVIYYLFPFAIGILLLAVQEAWRHRKGIARTAGGLSRTVSAVAPRALALTTFLGGLILLASGATPGEINRIHWLARALPLPVMEVSHFLGSVAGAGLLFLARGIQRRLNAAWYLTLVVLGAGIVFSLAKGLDWEEATILGAMFAAVAVSRDEFYRKSSLLDQRFTAGWLAAIALALAGTVWLGLFAYKHIEYSNELWWHFGLRGDAPRFLRATAGVAVVALIFSAARLLRQPLPRRVAPDDVEIEEAVTLAAGATSSNAWLVALRDKRLLFSEDRRAFIMYGVAGRSWVALGDPVGPAELHGDLGWRFRELADQQGAWTVFYEVPAASLPIYIDMGLSIFKLGEEARVPLKMFTLEGGARRSLRNTRSRLEREGCSFAVWNPAEVSSRMGELRAISDDWLIKKQSREKGFSLGRFDETYISRFPAGIVLREGRPVAFANLWLGGESEEMSVDLMRYSSDAPTGVMEYLFIQLLLHGAAEGFAWFNLGMAPLSGIDHHPLAPLWNRLGAVLFHHGEHFYNFQGLRTYKEKFDPTWQPKYLACPGGIILPRVLTNVASLVSGGVVGIVRK